MIIVKNLNKEFKIQKREDGTWASVKSLFHREYEIKKAVKDISFNINKGEIVGYIGSNGAGKSTTIKMLVGILVPTSGQIEVNKLTPHKNRIENSKNIGIVFGQRTQLWWDIPVSESLNLMKYIYKIPTNVFHENMTFFSKLLELDSFKNTPVRQLSLGQRMRADLCAALLHNPEILYLDEPTIGLDVLVKQNIREFIKEVNKKRDTTIILTTHDMSDIEKLSSRVMVIDNGSIIYDGNLEKLKATFGSSEIINLKTKNQFTGHAELYNIGVDDILLRGTEVIIKYNKLKINSSQILRLCMNNTEILDFVVQTTEIEEIIRNLYKNNTR